MDCLNLMPTRRRVAAEAGGRHHYVDNAGSRAPREIHNVGKFLAIAGRPYKIGYI